MVAKKEKNNHWGCFTPLVCLLYSKRHKGYKMTGFIERVLSVQTLNNKRGCTQRVIVVNDVAQQFDDMPTPSADTLGLIVQYTGETTADFTHGYFYEGSSSTTSSSATATQTVGSSLTDIAVDVETLETFTGWTTDNSLQIFYTDDGWSVDTTSLGVTYTGTPSVGDAITISYTAGVTTYGWQQVDVQPSGGDDQHNLGWYATPEALRTAHATATAGDWAIVGSTDTVWIWDTDTSAWKDSDQKGQVASVNGQTGTVVLTASDVGAATATQGAKADTAVQPADLATVATTGDYDDLTNKPTIPAAQVNSDWNASSGVAQILNKPTLGTMAAESASDYTKTANLATVATTGAYSDLSGTPTIPDPTQVSTLPTASATEEGKIYQFIGTTTASYTNGYFYKCVSDGQNPATYSWEEVEVQASSGGGLPDMTGQSGRFLTTDGSSASWSNQLRFDYSSSWLSVNSTVVLTALHGIGIGDSYGVTLSGSSVAIGSRAKAASSYGGIAIGYMPEATGNDAISIGWFCKATADYAIQIGGWGGVNSDANTFKVANNNGNFEIMSADGTIPEARLADTTNATAGQVLTLDSNLNAVWAADPHRVIDFQAPTAQNNYTWYRKYADGWVEQGGVYTGSLSAGNSVAITLAVTMSDTNYTLNITGEQNSNNYSYAVIKDGSKTTTGFSLFAGGGSGGDSINAACWQVSGMAA